MGLSTSDRRMEQSRAEQSRAEQSRAEQSRAEQSRAELLLLFDWLESGSMYCNRWRYFR